MYRLYFVLFVSLLLGIAIRREVGRNYKITLESPTIWPSPPFDYSVVIGDINGGNAADPDVTRSVPQLIESRGFTCETHKVVTQDGYILTIHRIVNPLLVGSNLVLKPVILQHPLMGSGADFLINTDGGQLTNLANISDDKIGNNLGFELSNRGYDVWLPNVRGNSYSLEHISLKVSDRKFWEFSFDEMIKYDLPFTIDYIRTETNSTTVGYVGHSQGTLVMFGLLATHPEYNSIIKPFIAMAPVAEVGEIKSPIKYIAYNKPLMDFFTGLGGPFLVNSTLISRLSTFCPRFVIKEMCQSITFLFCGPDSRQLNMTRFPVYTSHTPSGTSTLNIVHFGQMIKNKKMTFYDYGTKVNMRKYGSKTPPEYQLEKITNPNIALISAKNDWQADPQDVATLRSRLQVKLLDDYTVPNKEWNHLDFIWAIDAGKEVNHKVLQLLKAHV